MSDGEDTYRFSHTVGLQAKLRDPAYRRYQARKIDRLVAGNRQLIAFPLRRVGFVQNVTQSSPNSAMVLEWPGSRQVA